MGMNLLVGYTGAYQDPVTGSYPLGNGCRMYFPELMRFNTPDGWSPFGKGGIHPYAYCSGDPINHSDPSGHFGFLGIGLQILAIGLMMMPGAAGIAEEVVEEGAISGVLAANGAREGAAETVAGSLSSSSGAMAKPAEETEDLARAVVRLRLGGSHAPGPEPDPYAGVREDLGNVRTQLEELEPRMMRRLDELFGPPGKKDTIRWRWGQRDRLMVRQKALNSGENHKNVMKGYEGELRAIHNQLQDINRRGQDFPSGPITDELYGEYTVLVDGYERLIDEWNLHAKIVNDITRTIVPL